MVDLAIFRRSLTAASFAQRAFKAVEQLSREEYWLRPRDSDAKKLIEEVLPLAMAAKQLDIPGRRVYCKHLGRSDDDCDGVMTFKGEWVNSGFIKPRYSVEVTTAQFEKAHYVREALHRYGSVFDDPDIKRLGSRARGSDQIVSRAVVQDDDQVIKDSIRWVDKVVKEKVRKSYPEPCVLIVSLSSGRPLSLGEWLEVVKSFPRELAKSRFEFALLVDTDRGVVHEIRLR